MRVIWLPGAKATLQVFVQLIPAGVLTTVPCPVPDQVTVSSGKRLKVAVTDAFALKVTLHGPVPLQAPIHPVKTEFEAGEAVRVTRLPIAKEALHDEPQFTPAGALTTVP